MPLVPLLGGVNPRMAGPSVQVDAECSQFPVKFKLTVAHWPGTGSSGVPRPPGCQWAGKALRGAGGVNPRFELVLH